MTTREYVSRRGGIAHRARGWTVATERRRKEMGIDTWRAHGGTRDEYEARCEHNEIGSPGRV